MPPSTNTATFHESPLSIPRLSNPARSAGSNPLQCL
uniref:Uncharacterized protein n=1 Tax=Myoviridae sp. cta6i12 TaxID=2827695 RepID=A0A8S5T711_9CAUD|nr:MAG TPA: hypothetical protein [Myoviridae sp. cta6i12]